MRARKPCAELRVEDHLYELFTMGVALVLCIGYLALGFKGLLWGSPSVGADSVLEFVAAVTAIYASVPIHEGLHWVAITLLRRKAGARLARLKHYVIVLEVYGEGALTYSELLWVTLFPLLGSLALAALSVVPISADYPAFVLSLGVAALSAWDLYLALALRGVAQVASFHYEGTRVKLSGDCAKISHRLALGTSGERYAKHWAGWTWFFFVVLGVMFVLVELGSIGFKEGFTLSAGPILIFSVEPVEGGFRTIFNPPGAFVVSALLAIPFAYLSKRVVEWLG